MEYYPIYITIKNWIQKNLFLSISLLSLLIIVLVIQINKFNIFIAGENFDQALIARGRKEIIFKFNNDIIKFGSYDTNTTQWLEIMNLSFDPPQTGNIRTISGDSFAYIFDTPVPRSEDLEIRYSTNIQALDGSKPTLMIDYQPSITSPFVHKGTKAHINYATRNGNTLTNSIILYANQPINKSKLAKALSITNAKGQSILFRTSYEVTTNQTHNHVYQIQTNYDTIKISPYFLKKHQTYRLDIDKNKTDAELAKSFNFDFSTYKKPEWLGISQNAYIEHEITPISVKNTSQKTELQTLLAMKPFWILHNTQLIESDHKHSKLTITPEVNNLKYTIEPQGIQVSGDFKSGEEYQLTFIPKNISDQYKQNINELYQTNFKVTSPKPQLRQVENILYVDREKPIVKYQTLNVTNVTITYQVISSAYYTATTLYGRVPPIPYKTTNITLDSPLDKITWQELDISSIVDSSRTAMLIRMNIRNADVATQETNFTKVLVSSSGITAQISSDDLLLQAKDIKTQKPLELMMISIWDSTRGSFQDLGRTKSDGTLRIPNPKLPSRSLEKPIFIGIYEEPELFNHIAFLSGEESFFEGIDNTVSFYSSPQLLYYNSTSKRQISAMISTDRPNYKFGENIHIHILARGKTNNNYTSKSSFFKSSLKITVLDPQQRTITNFTHPWSDFGSLDFQIRSNQIKQFGSYTIQIENPAYDFYAQQNFVIESLNPKNTELVFESCEYKYRFGETLDFSLHPRFLYGTAIPSKIDYHITGYSIPFHSKKYPLYNFGSASRFTESTFAILGKGKTDQKRPIFSTKHKLIEKTGNNLQLTIFAESRSDIAKPIDTENRDIKVYQPYQLGIYTEKNVITNNEIITFDLINIDPITENIISNKIFSSFKISQNKQFNLGIFGFITNILPLNLHYQKQVYHKNISTGQSKVHFEPKNAGDYQVEYSINTNGAYIHSQLSFVVLEEHQQIPKSSSLTMELGKPIYESGEKAFLYIKNPFASANLLLTIERDNIREFYTLITTNHIISHPIVLTYQDEPGVNISAVLTEITTNNIPHILYGKIAIPMHPINKTLQIVAKTSKSNYLPKEEIELNISAYNSFNQAIDGEAFVVIRDRAVLNKENDNITSPIEHFYSNRPARFNTWDSGKVYLDLLNLTNSHQRPILYNQLARTMAIQHGDAISAMSYEIRSNFPFTLYSDTVKLSKDKKTTITFQLPDNISGFDISILAYNKNQLFGKTNTYFTTSKQLIVEDILPLFLRPQDKITWGAYVRNLSSEELNTTVILNNNETISTQQINISAESSAIITNSTRVSTNNTTWTIKAFGNKFQDSLLRNIPIIKDNPWLSSAYSGLVSKETNFRINLNKAKQHSIQVQIDSTPVLKIKNTLKNLLNSQTLSFNTISQKLLLILGNEELLIKTHLIDLSKEQLQKILQKHISQLKNYYVDTTRIALIPNSNIYSTDPIDLLKIYEILLKARRNNYTIDHGLLTKMEKIANTLSRRPHSIAQAYALNLLANAKILDIEIFKSIYPNLPQNINSQALILDTMYSMDFSLKDISAQTLKLVRYTSETSSELIIPSPTRFNISTLIYYFGAMQEGIKILNYTSDDENNLLFAAIAFLKKYPRINTYKGKISINNKDYQLSDITNNITTTITDDTQIKIKPLDNTPLFYNIIYSYIPKEIISDIDSGYKIERKIYSTNNQEKSLSTLQKDMEYIVELTITGKNEGNQQIEIMIPQYGGTIFVPKQTIVNGTYVQTDDKVYIYTRINGTKTIRYSIKASYQGEWNASPISVNSLNSKDLFGIHQQSMLKIQ